MDTKLTVRVPRRLLENAKRYAAENNTTLTELISAYLKQIPVQDEAFADAPVVRSLIGIILPDVSIDDYRRHLDEKYGSK